MNARSLQITAAVVLAFVAAVLSSGMYILDQTEEAIILRLGAWQSTVLEPGLHFKMPFLESAVVYDRRLLALNTPDEQILLGDQKRVVVDTYTRYRIVDPLKFYQSVRSESNARSQLGSIIQSSMRRVMGTIMMPTLLSDKRTDVMRTIQKDVAEVAKPLGVEVVDVRLRRADLPDETSQAIYDRMKSERERQAKELRAQGYEWGQQIKGKADRDRTVILAESQRQSQILRGEGDAQSSRIYGEAFSQDSQFYAFYRTLQAYRSSLGEGTTLVLSPDNDFLKYLGNGPRR
jgi:membrane protease subunit HflC